MIEKILQYINTAPDEIWAFVTKTTRRYYFISSCGRFLSAMQVNKRRGERPFKVKIINPYPDRKGYMHVRINNNGKTLSRSVHRLVLSIFRPIYNENKRQVNHIDGDKKNNNLSNLEWCTCKENINHAIKNGLINNTKKVCQYDLSGSFIKEYSSISEAESTTGVFTTNICYCCNGKVRQAGGYQWRYERCENIGKVRKKKIAPDLKTRYCKPVIALQNGKEMNRFNSVKEAGLFIGKPHAEVNISACALGKRHSAYGYHWKYAISTEEFNPYK